MVSVGVSALGCADLHFVAGGVTINGQHYRDVLLTQNLLPDMRQYSDFYIFHISRMTHQLKRERDGRAADIREMPDFISASLWPPNNPDLNPAYYTIRDMLHERVYREKIRTVKELQRRITQEWELLDQRVIDNAVKQWRKRLCACVAANGEHFEHLL